jgi:hypothetical protein
MLPHHDHRPAFVLGGGAHLVINQGEPVPARHASAPDFPLIAFAVDDLDSAIKHLNVHEIELPWGVEAGREGRWVRFKDPAGNVIEFAQFN